MGGWDELPLQQQSQLKVFIKPQPLLPQCLAELHFPLAACIRQAPCSSIPTELCTDLHLKARTGLLEIFTGAWKRQELVRVNLLKVLRISSKVYCRLAED